MSMEVFEAIHGRRSIRKFKPDPVPPEFLYRVLDAARWSPSAGNLQSWEFVIVRDDNVKEELAQAAVGQSFIQQAPTIIVVCSDTQRSSMKYGERGKVLYSLQEASAATQTLMLAAHALGLGTCWVGAFFEEKVAETLKLPAGVVPVAIVPLGYPAMKPRPPHRADLTDLIHFDWYGNKKVLTPGAPTETPQPREEPVKEDVGLVDFFA